METEEQQNLIQRLLSKITNREVLGAGYEIGAGLTFDAITSPLGLAPPVYAALNFGEGYVSNVIAQKIRGQKWNEIDWNEAMSSGALGVIPLSQLRAAKYLRKPAAQTVEKVVGKSGTLQRNIISGGIIGGGDVTIRSGLEGELPDPAELATGVVGGGALAGTLTPVLKRTSKYVNEIVAQRKANKAESELLSKQLEIQEKFKNDPNSITPEDTTALRKAIWNVDKAKGDYGPFDSYEEWKQQSSQLLGSIKNKIDDSLPSDRPDRDGLLTLNEAPTDYPSMWRSQNFTKLDKWKSRALLKLKGQKTYSGTQYKTIEDIPDLRIPRSAVFRKFKGKSNFSEVEDALYEYEYGALVHRELEGQGSLAGFRPFEGYASRGYLDPEGESWIFRSKGTTRGVKNYQWNKAVAVSKAATKRLEAEKQVLKELDTQLGYVAEITNVPKKDFANITKQSAIEKASREQLQQQIKIQRQELGLEGEALLHDKHLKDLHLEHVVGVLQYPEFLRSTHGMNWILNRKNNHGLAGYHKEPPPIWSVILAGKHNKWFVDIVQDAFATPTRPKNKSGYKKPKLSGKDLGLGTDEGKRLFTYPEVLPNFTEKGSIPGDMIISTWDGTQTWRVPRALAILDFIENKNITRAIIQGTRKNKYKDGLLARIISGEKVDISEQVLVGELITRAKELKVSETLLRKYWNRADLESKQEILWLLEKMGAKQEFIEQIGTEMITEKGTPYLIKGGYIQKQTKE